VFQLKFSQFAVLAIFILNGCDTQRVAPLTSGAPGNGRTSTGDPTAAVPVIYYEAERVDDGKEGDRHLTYEDFLDVRFDLREVCNRHGDTRPDGDNPARDCVFFLVDDFYNEWERYQYVEICKASGMTRQWLVDVMASLSTHKGWRLGVGGLAEGYAIVFADKIMITGEAFRGCATIDQFITAAQNCLRINELMRHADDERFEEVSRIATHRKRLDLRDAQVTDAGLAHVRAFSKLVELDLHGTSVTDAGLIHLDRLTGLQKLSLSETRITDQGLLHLRSLSELKELILDDTAVRGHVFEELESLKQLEELWLQSTKVDDEGLRQLRAFHRLKVLHLSEARITDEGLAFLQPLVELQELSLVAVPISEKGLRNLVSCGNLRKLSLSRTPVTDSGVQIVASLSKLEDLYLDNTAVTDRALEYLGDLKSLKTVFVHQTKVTDRGIKRLRRLLPDAWIASERL
jgi:hypothetical protein